MRKIYSLVLMTAMLFVGTNMWASTIKVGTTQDGGKYADIQTAIDSASTGDTIRLVSPISLDPSQSIWLGTRNVNDPSKSIVLDMNGKNITCTTNGTKDQKILMFVLTHGELKVINTSPVLAEIQQIKGSCEVAVNSYVFTVFGTYQQGTVNTRESGYFSHLEIGNNVKISAHSGTGICIDHATTADAFKKVMTANGGNYGYLTNVLKRSSDGDRGFAFGVKVDVKGEIVIMGETSPSKKTYAIKANGNLASPLQGLPVRSASANTYDAFLNSYTYSASDTAYVPFIHVDHSAVLKTSNTQEKSAAVYASGYAKWLIEGNLDGNIGLSVSSGTVEINDATITSSATTYKEPSDGGSVSGSGSAIVVNSKTGYAGDIAVTISGDSEIKASSGYAIEETVKTTTEGSKCDSIVITGGTIEGGNQGAIAVTTTEGTGDDKHSVTTVYSGNVSGIIVDNSDSEKQDTIQVTDLVKDTENTHTSVIVNENGSAVTVISPGKSTGVKWYANIAATADGDSVKLIALKDTIKGGTKILAELEMNRTDSTNLSKLKPIAQELVIKNNATVKIGKVILGAKATIVVEAGSKLIITGNDGIYSRDTNNIVLQATATDQALFVLGDSVISNRQPYATVEFTPTVCYKTAPSTTWIWQRFATPMDITKKPRNNSSSLGITTYPDGYDRLRTFVKVINEETETWEDLASWSKMRPFQASSITNNTPEDKNATYTFTGKLMGNVTDSLMRKPARWNYYGNSFMAPISTQALVAVMPAQHIEGTIWFWNVEDQVYETYNPVISGEFNDGIMKIPALSFFVTKNTNSEVGSFNIDYKNSVYDYAVNPGKYEAPARQMGNSNTVRISITSESGMSDKVYILENGVYNAEYEGGADIEKLMKQGLNIYAVDNAYNYNLIATDDVLGTMISLTTTEDINYTLSFGKVRGEVYALRDNLTNAVVLMNEGATYNFTAQPNATLDGRFQIVSRQEMPTAVETIEETVAPKAIYTIMGQYVGETTDWNNLPAGVYVVDGVKVIK